MQIKRINGIAVDIDDIKAVGDEVFIDGERYIIVEMDSTYDEYLGINNVNYKLDKEVIPERTMEELQELR